MQEAVKLVPSDGETVATVRRRLGAAVNASGKSVQIRRSATIPLIRTALPTA